LELGPLALARQLGSAQWWGLAGALLLAGVLPLATYWGGPLTVAANVKDDGGGWPRNSNLVFTFSQDMEPASVQQSFRLRPEAPVSFRAESLRRFVFTPLLQANVSYEVSLARARRADRPFSVKYRQSFRTAPAPTVAQITLSDTPLTEGQKRIPLQPALRIHFTQPMDPGRVEVILDGVTLQPASWDPGRKTAGLGATLLPGREHTLTVPARVRNARQDTMLADHTLHFRSMVEVPSSGTHALDGPPALVQIDNAGPARPQAGLQDADLVYEYLTEYDISRFTAVFFSAPPALVGPVRSARLVSIPLQQSLQGALFCSGAGDYVLGQLWGNHIPMHINDYSAGGVFHRDQRRFAPHNLMIDGSALDQHRRDFQLPVPGYVLAPSRPDIALPGGTPADRIAVPAHGVVWQTAGSEYLRWDSGRPFQDANTGQQVHAKNVILQMVPTRLTDIVEDVNGGAKTLQYEMSGEGLALVYSGGQMVSGRWRRSEPTEPIEYLDASGNPIRFNSGLTWVHLVSA
jgi:hypothetical protein